jgi:hypothetical protein
MTLDDESIELFAKENGLSTEALEELKAALSASFQCGYDACMIDDKDPELSLDDELRAIRELFLLPPDKKKYS